MNSNALNSNPANRLPSGFARSTIESLATQCAPNQLALLRLLAVAHQQKLELIPLLCSLGMELSNFDRGRIANFSEAIQSGTPYIEALSLNDGILPKNCVTAIQIAEHNDTLSDFYAATLTYATTIRVSSHNPVESESSRIIRFTFRTLIIGLCFTWFGTSILPVFFKMTSEYGIEIPTRLVVLTDFLEYGFGFFSIGVPLLFLIFTPLWLNLGRDYLRTWNPMHWKKPSYSTQTENRLTLALLNSYFQSNESNENRRSEIVREAIPEAAQWITKTPLDSDTWQQLQNIKILSQGEVQALNLAGNTTTQSWLLRRSGTRIEQKRNHRRSFFIHWFMTTIDVCIALFIIAFFNTIFLYYLEIIAAVGKFQ